MLCKITIELTFEKSDCSVTRAQSLYGSSALERNFSTVSPLLKLIYNMTIELTCEKSDLLSDLHVLLLRIEHSREKFLNSQLPPETTV